MTLADLLRRYEPDLRATATDTGPAREEVMRSLRRDARGVRVDDDELEALEKISRHAPAEFAEAITTLIVELSKRADG